MIKCPDCGNEISEKAKACPHCGRPINPNKGCTLVVGVLLVVFGMLMLFSGIYGVIR